MRIAVDVDLTLCEERGDLEYIDVPPKLGAVAAMQKLKNAGHEIIIYTARGMGSFKGDLGLIYAKTLPVLEEWLNKHDIPYDDIVCGKILYDVLIDDKAMTFKDNWDEISDKLV